MNKFQKALQKQNTQSPPVWMMRQAGRYHSHYQNIRKDYSFLQVCKTPNVAAEVAMGPMRDFDFDAAILFSDILFPLEAMGVPLDFNPGPQLGYHFRTLDDLQRYNENIDPGFFKFQADGLTETRKMLSADKGLIGFVGAPLTLYFFAVEGSHKKDISSALAGFHDGRFDAFMERLLPVLLRNMETQATANPDAMAIFDSCAGDISLADYKNIYLPYLTKLLKEFQKLFPNMPVIYYGKKLNDDFWPSLTDLPITCLGVDHYQDIQAVLKKYGQQFAIQGNFDPEYLTLPPEEFRAKAVDYLTSMKNLPADLRKGWICGLGHGVTPAAREDNVRNFVQLSREILG